MKITIRHSMPLVAIVICLTMAACSHYPEQDAVLAAQNEKAISDTQYGNLFLNPRYDSVEDLYRGLRDFDSSELQYIRSMENQHLEDTKRRTQVTEAELRDGIFGNLRNQLLREETLLVPYYQNREIPYLNKEGASNITLFESQACRKPWILFRSKIGDEHIFLQTMYYDRNLLEAANEKGASWLLSQLKPEGTNVYNYEERYPPESNVTVYEKELQLGDRDVLAMIIDNSLDEEYPGLSIYFVYDDILVGAWRGTPEFMLDALKDITFREVSLPDNMPLRGTPGREGTRFSTRDVSEQGTPPADELETMPLTQEHEFGG